MYKYKLFNTGYSSSKYGLCEVCNDYASEIYHQIEMKHYMFECNSKVYEGWTNYGCHNLFGHKGCLLSKRKEVVEG